jgi:hypothetical protein
MELDREVAGFTVRRPLPGVKNVPLAVGRVERARRIPTTLLT